MPASLPSCPIFFVLSDRSDKADRLQGFQLKANDYLAKPFYPEELTARIRERFTSQLSGVAEDEMQQSIRERYFALTQKPLIACLKDAHNRYMMVTGQK